jgi:hypothetical protein
MALSCGWLYRGIIFDVCGWVWGFNLAETAVRERGGFASFSIRCDDRKRAVGGFIIFDHKVASPTHGSRMLLW